MLPPGTGWVRRLIGCFAIALVTAGCGDATVGIPVSQPRSDLLVRASPSPYSQITAGPVSAVIPDDWRARLAGRAGDPREGFIAAPRPGVWELANTPAEGMAAVWIDGTRVGVPSDYYYLAATGPALELITRSSECSATRHHVIVDHLPAFAAGEPESPGDYVASGRGRCKVGGVATRWAYFVAAPGYGPVRQVGIPSSGLYLILAVLPDSPRAPAILGRILLGTEFGGASITDFITAARASRV